MSLPSPQGHGSIESVQTEDDHGRQVQAMFSSIAHGYDRANRWMSLGADVRWRRQAVRNLETSDETDPSLILDLCAGTMDSSQEIHQQFPSAKILAGDFSAGMLEYGRQRLIGKARKQIVPVELDAHHLPLADHSVDAIFCAFGIRNLSDLLKATREQARCLKPGGKLVIVDFFRPDSLASRAIHALYNRTVLPAVGWACTGNLQAYLYLPRSIGKFQTVNDYGELLRSLDFTDVAVTPLTLNVASIVSAIRK